LTTNISPNLYATKNGATPRITLTVTFAAGTFTVKRGATTITTATSAKGLHEAAHAVLRAAGPYDPSTWVDYIMPLNGGGTRTESRLITDGMHLSTSKYDGDSQA
jgi:hypothetical protein